MVLTCLHRLVQSCVHETVLNHHVFPFTHFFKSSSPRVAKDFVSVHTRKFTQTSLINPGEKKVLCQIDWLWSENTPI